MALQRKTSDVIPVAIDVSATPAPLLSFNIIKPKVPEFPTGGLSSKGNIKFNLKNVIMVAHAKAGFDQFSLFKGDNIAFNNFLLSLSITSKFEGGGFDAINTYDNAGVSIGIIQFARPEAGAGKLFRLLGRTDLDDKIKKQFGTADPHSSPGALIARNNKTLLSEIVTVAASPEGIRVQFAMAINQNVEGQHYFDKAFKRFLDLKLKDPLCAAMLFDAAVNMGAGSVDNFKSPVQGQTDGDWLAANVSLLKRKERRIGWRKIIAENFA